MKNPKIRAWCCVGVMMLGAITGLVALWFLNQQTVFTVLCVAAVVVFFTGMLLYFIFVRCPHCDSYLGRVYGTRCPFCGKEYDGN